MDVAHAAVPVQAAGVRSAGHHRERPDRLHAGAARRGDQGGRRATSSGPIYTPPTLVTPTNKGTIVGAGPRRRRELAWRRRRSGDRLRLCRLDHDAGCRRARAKNTDPVRSRVDSDYTMGGTLPTVQGLAPAQAAVRPHHRLRHEQGRDRLADPERRHAAEREGQPGAQGRHDSRRPAAPRMPACW